MSSSLKQKILSGVLWQGLEKFGNQGISFLISVILARLLAPEEFGVLAILMVFTGLCGVFVDAGFSSALVQRKKLEERDCCSVFYINIITALFLYLIVFLTAPMVAKFYNTYELCLYLRVMAAIVPIRAFGLVQRALLSRNMLFHLSFRISWAALLSSGTVAVIMAYRGFGAWSLVTQQIINAIVSVGCEWIWIKWRPQLLFHWQAVKDMFNFGWKLFFSSILNTLYYHIYSIVIGKFFNLNELSYYNRGQSIPNLGINIVNSTIVSVIFPALSQTQDDKSKAKLLVERGIKNVMFLVAPIVTLIFIFAEQLVLVLLTEKWLPCVNYLRVFCIVYFFWPLHMINLQVYTAFGRSDIFLILEIIKKVQTALIIFFTYRYGIRIMVLAQIPGAALGFIENSWYNKKLLNYSPLKQIVDFSPFVIAAVLSGTVTHFTILTIINPWFKIITGGTLFSLLYIFSVYIQHKIPQDIIELLKKFLPFCKKC